MSATLATKDGILERTGQIDDDGHFMFTLKSHVITSDPKDGPLVAMLCPGLPVTGSMWNIGNDFFPWAFCLPGKQCEQYQRHGESEPTKHWVITQKFSTKPLRRCQDTQIENPLLEPMKVSGSFVKYSREQTKDFNGKFFKSSSHEILRGPSVEFQRSHPQVVIEQNVAYLGLEDFSPLIDGLNDAPIWNCPIRCVQFSDCSWEQKWWGVCTYYYTRRFTFDIDFNTFDRKTPDEGTKVLRGHWRHSQKELGSSKTYLYVPIGAGASFKLEISNTATDADVQNALATVPGLPAGIFNCTGGPLPATPIDIEFVGDAAAHNWNLLQIKSSLYEITNQQEGSPNPATNEIQRIEAIGANEWVLDGKPKATNPADFIRFKDRNGENARTLLKNGLPIEDEADIQEILLQPFPQFNLLDLGIPVTL